MSYKDYSVRIVFNDGTNSYTFPYVFGVSDPKEGSKATIIPGKRGDGSIYIPGGKKSQDIIINGNIFDENGYEAVVTKMNEMRAKVTTKVASLTMEHFDTTLSGGGDWVTDWAYSVVRIDEISFKDSLRTGIQEYSCKFLVLAY